MYQIGDVVEADTGIGTFLGTITDIDHRGLYEVTYDAGMGHGLHSGGELHLASRDYPEFGDILYEHPSPEKSINGNPFASKLSTLHVAGATSLGDSAVSTGDSVQRSSDLGAIHNTDIVSYPKDTKCALCNLHPIEVEVDHTPMCGWCAQHLYGVDVGDTEPQLWGQKMGARVSAAGLAVVAADTGRVLLLQRALDDDDPAGGDWEFPGGHLEGSESPIEAAVREWKEEIGTYLPPGHFGKSWIGNGMYQGFVYVIPSEKDLPINLGEDRHILNPDDPDQDQIEIAAWFEPRDLPKMPGLRKEVKNGTDWSVFHKRSLPKAASFADEHLPNPTGGYDWYHGTPHDFQSFDDPEPEDEEDGYGNGYDEDSRPHPHWNTYLGTHWTSLPQVANRFARGMYHNLGEKSVPGHVFTANLGVTNPKHYKSEYDMDGEAFGHAWGHYEAHDPEGAHERYCNRPDCYGLEEHTPGDEVDRFVREHYEEPTSRMHWLSSHPDAHSIAWVYRRRLQEQGHDGLTYGNESPEEGPEGHRCAITFDNSQIHNLRRNEAGKHVAASLDEFVGAMAPGFDTPYPKVGEYKDLKLRHPYRRDNYIVNPNEYDEEDYEDFEPKEPSIVSQNSKVAADGYDPQAHIDADNLYARSGSHHVSCGRYLPHHVAVHTGEWERYWNRSPESSPVPGFALEGARAYRDAVGLPHPEVDYSHIMANRDRHLQIARQYLQSPSDTPGAHRSFEAFRNEINRQYDHLTRRMGIRVEASSHDPYANHHEMLNDVLKNRRLKVLSTGSTGSHPFLSDEDNDHFRAVHDFFGHVATGRSFDRHGEEAAWHHHGSMFSELARGALTTETRGQNAALIHTGEFPPQKMVLLPKEFWSNESLKSVRANRHLAVNAEDEIPPRPGTAPIPEGHVRLFHYTYPENLPSIRQYGLTRSHARGHTYGEPDQVWAAAGVPPEEALHHKPYVEFHANPDLHGDLNIGEYYGQGGSLKGHIEHLEGNRSHVTMRGDVPLENIVAIHEPWHQGYHYLSQDKDAVRAGEYDWVHDDPSTEAQYGKAIRKIKSEAKWKLTDSFPLGPGQGHYFEPEEEGSPWCKICGGHISVTSHPIRHESSWTDVLAKAKRLREEGKVRIIQVPNDEEPYLFGQVEGDDGVYHPIIHLQGGKRLQQLCDCAWGSFGEYGPNGDQRAADSPYRSRPCSHLLALRHEYQSRTMFGRKPHLGALEDGYESFFHLTDNPKFHLDPEKAPQDNSITLSRILGPERKGLYVSKNPERWINGYDYVRPYVAEIHAHPEHVERGEYSGEGFIPSANFDHVKIHRVIPLDAYAREEYGEHGWIERHHGTTFDTKEPIPLEEYYPFHGYHYDGPDVRDMSKRETNGHKNRWLKYLKENRGFDQDILDDLRQHTGALGFLRTAQTTPKQAVAPNDAPWIKKAEDYQGEEGNPRHITRSVMGVLPTYLVEYKSGVNGEMPGEHRNRWGQDWEDFKSDIAQNGIKNPIFITVDHGERPKISEGNHRRDAAVELGMKHVPVEIRYFGHSERHCDLEDKAHEYFTEIYPHLRRESAREKPQPEALRLVHKVEDFKKASSLIRGVNGVSATHEGYVISPPSNTVYQRGDYGGPWTQADYRIAAHDLEGNEVGHLEYSHFKSGDENSLNIQHIEVHPDHRGHNLGRVMYHVMRANHLGTEVNPGYFTDDGSKWWNSNSMAHARGRHTAAEEEWRGLHQPSLDGPPVHNLLEPSPAEGEAGWSAPPDIYTHMHYYGDGNDRADSESMSAIRSARAEKSDWYWKPVEEKYGPEYVERRKAKRAAGEHLVTIYRGAPKGIKEIGAGDWVTLSPTYAREHGFHATDKTKDWPVYKARVPAKHVRWAGDSLNEFGYNGPPVKAYVHYRGGKNAERIEETHREAALTFPDDTTEDRIQTDPHLHVGADGEPHSGVMVALVPPDDVAKKLAVENGEDPYDIHTTIAYLGKKNSVDEGKLLNALIEFARTHPVMHGSISGFGNFEIDPESNDGFSHAHVALVDIPHIAEFRADLEDILDRYGISVDHTHGLSPHITIGYGHEPMEYDQVPEVPGTFPFKMVTMAYGGTWRHVPLGFSGL